MHGVKELSLMVKSGKKGVFLAHDKVKGDKDARIRLRLYKSKAGKSFIHRATWAAISVKC